MLCLVAACSLVLVPVSPGVSYGVRTVTAVVAVVVLLRVGVAPGRASRALLAAALLAGITSGVAAAGYLLVTGRPSPAGGLSDWVYLLYGPLAGAGLLLLPRHPQEGPWRLRAFVDAAIAVSALAFALAPTLTGMARTTAHQGLAVAAALAYPLCSVFAVAVLLAVLPRVQRDLRPFLHVVGLGLGLLMAGDVGYAVGTLHDWYTPTTWPAVCTQAGLALLVAAAPLRGRAQVQLVPRQDVTPSLLEMTAPYLAVLPAIVMDGVILARGQRFSQTQMFVAVFVGLALISRQLLTNADHRRSIERLEHREREAHAASLCDPLTGLGNRAAVLESLGEQLAAPDRRTLALALLDLDDFKDINDRHGHETGDAVLCEIASRLRFAVPEGAVIARLGGDEFAVCVRTDHRVRLLGEVLRATLDEPVHVGERSFAVTASIGVVVADAGHTPTPAVAMSHVDVAMYQAKAVKVPQRSTVVVLAGQARDQAAARVRLRDEVSHPELEQFHVVYEPMVDLSDGQVIGAEALLRWRHPVLGDVPPSTFVPLAEQVGAIHELGEFALRTAAADLAGWLAQAADAGDPLLRASVGVNLSPRQLGDPSLCDLVREVLEVNGLQPYQLVLEITEEALLDDWGTAVEVVRDLRDIGIAVAVDDFGTGYSSLRYLRRFDTCTVKIDREFVQAVADEPRTRALVASVLEMSRSLDLYSVAEGIETLDQLQVLRALGCRFAQGYLFDKPMAPEAFGTLLTTRHRYPMGPNPAGGLVPVPREHPGPRQVMPATLPVVPIVPRRTG